VATQDHVGPGLLEQQLGGFRARIDHEDSVARKEIASVRRAYLGETRKPT
jgi:hypothetical protein